MPEPRGPSLVKHCEGHGCGLENLPKEVISGQAVNIQAGKVEVMVGHLSVDKTYQVEPEVPGEHPDIERENGALLRCARIIVADQCPLYVTHQTAEDGTVIALRSPDTLPRPQLHVVGNDG
jgi:hypothetical protein